MSWRETIRPITDKFDLAAMFHMDTGFNAKGSAAISRVMKQMADTIDQEIVRIVAVEAAERRALLGTVRLLGLKLTISRDG